MGTFSGGFMLDPTTGRPVSAAPIAVTDYTTGAPVVPDGGPLATGAFGGYGRFTAAGVDAVVLRAGGVEQIVVSIEQQLEGATGGTDGGVRMVSGTVDLTTSDPRLVEVYATAAATVEGITLAQDDAAVFSRTAAGTWRYMIVGQNTTWQTISGGTTPPTDTTNPTPGTISESDVTEAGFTVTIVGASDAGGLHAQPYAFSTDNGDTWTAYQSSASYAATGLTPETAYQVKGRVKDAAGNTADTPAKTVTTTAAPVVVKTYIEEVLADAPLHFLPLDDETGATSARNLGTAGAAWTPSGGVTFGATAIGSLTRSATFTQTTSSKITGPATVLAGQTSWTVVALIIRGASQARQGVVGSSRVGGWGIVLNDNVAYGYKDSTFSIAGNAEGGSPYLIAFTYDGSSLKGYLNGVLHSTGGKAVTGATVEPNAVTIGAVGSDASMAGQIAGVAIFPGKVLTAARLAAYAEAAGVA